MTRVRVLHVNDVAGVAGAAVQQAVASGLDWALWPLPAVRGAPVPVKAYRRARDLVRFHPAGRAADVLHVHYGLFGYYAWSVRRPYLLHLHGTDLRDNLASPLLRPLVRRAIRRAGAVAYSTPDMADATRALRPDAVWLPAPLPLELCVAGDGGPARATDDGTERDPEGGAAGEAGTVPGDPVAGTVTGQPARPRTVVFASRWDPVKGLAVLLQTADQLRRDLPGADLVGVDWGTGAADARRAGVRLVPLMPAPAFRRMLAGADVVVGQQSSGSLGVAELEAMALGRPLVARFTHRDAYGEDAPLWNTVAMSPSAAVAQVLADPPEAVVRAGRGRDWALRHHGPQQFVRRCLELYQGL
ncbi:MAG TPA: glycosyltransferase [Nakamurella sp.]|nr:glycosyltransferase [Nakamurella sp.]